MSRFRLGCAVVFMVASGAPARPPHDARGGASVYVLSIEHVDQMGSSFELVGIDVTVDGETVLDHQDRPIPGQRCIYRRLVASGNHSVGAHARLHGAGAGVFSYLR